MSRSPFRPEGLAFSVFRGSDAVRYGVLSENQLRSAAWVRVCQDVYADSRLDRDHGLTCEAVRLRLPKDAVIAGASAAYLLGVAHAARFEDRVCVIAPKSIHIGTQRRVLAHHVDLDPADVLDGVTTAERTAWDVARWYEVTRAVSILDALLARGLVTPTGLASAGARLGSITANKVLALADGRAQSPPESEIRIRMILAGLPAPVPQHPIHTMSGVVLHPDLAWPEYLTALEYDGGWHGGQSQLERDRRRLNLLAAEGWTVFHATAADLRDIPRIAREVRHALMDRGWRPSGGTVRS
jgi:hypothetical protein